MNHVYCHNRACLQRSKHNQDNRKQGTKRKWWQRRYNVHRAQGTTVMTRGVKFTRHKVQLWWHNPWSSQGTRHDCDMHQETSNVTHGESSIGAKKMVKQAHHGSPQIWHTNWISLGMMVTHFAWMATKFTSSNNPTRYASAASCSTATAATWKQRSHLKSVAISWTR